MFHLISGLLLGIQKDIRVKSQKSMVFVLIRGLQKYPSLSVLSRQYPWLNSSKHPITSDASQSCSYSHFTLIKPILLGFYMHNIGICMFVSRKSIEFGVNVDALLSFLNCVPGLTELDICAEFLTDIWTSRILCYLQVNPKISHIKYEQIMFTY